MAELTTSANGEIPLEMTATLPGYQQHPPPQSDKPQADTTRLDQKDPSLCYGSIPPGPCGTLKDPLHDGHAPMLLCDEAEARMRPANDAASDLDDSDDDELCSWGSIHPKWCQMFRNPKVFLFCLCLATAVQGMIVNGFIGIVISSIERRFDLASTESGIGRKPRWLGCGIAIVGLGSFIFALPHFLSGLYSYDPTEEHDQCFPVGSRKYINSTEPICKQNERNSASSGLSSFKYMFIIAQLLHGAGAAPIYTLGVTFLDDNLKPKNTPVYVGAFYSMSIIGPALGYLMGGEFLKLYTDIGSIDVSRLNISVNSTNWVGAWWIGFLITAFLAFVISIPLNGFPTSLPGAKKLQAERVCEAYGGAGTETNVVELSLYDIVQSVKILLSNPTFVFLCLAGASEGLLLGGFTAFAPKFIESQFSISAGLAAQLVGFAMIPAGGGGTLLGAYLIRKFDLKCAGIIRLCLLTSFMSLIFSLVFVIRCPNVPFSGVNTNYSNPNKTLLVSNLTAACNNECDCNYDKYEPVCGSDNLMYFSACYAGCKQSVMHHSRKVFFNCSCVHYSTGAPLVSIPGHKVLVVAVEGKCKSDCQLLAVFLPFFALIILSTFCTCMPALSATLRCVPDRQRSFALGIQWILVRSLGTIPSPILFGLMIDGTCRLWQYPCPVRGSCLFYDNNTMGQYMLAMAICGKGAVFLFFMLSYSLYRPPPKQLKLSVVAEETMPTNATMQVFVRDGNVCKEDIQASVTCRSSPAQVLPLPAAPVPPKGDTTTSNRQLKYQQLSQ